MLDFSVTFFFTLINVGVLFFILRAILFKPVTKFMEERSNKIRNALEQAEKDKNQAKALLAQREEQLGRAEAEADACIQNARKAAEKEAAGIIRAGKDEAGRIIAAGRAQLEVERNAAMVQFRGEAAALVVAAASRLLRRELSGEDARRQAALLLNELGNP
ncbi:MAG: F0F1 ATP synthase subunit B [Spirochaetaceae bacterium]|jgi:F-type H+-transporting ATPase subunit b|nr:F0F1 ATP synthase subunit B [Spirochaetaceae bacterium]